jgi:hypothetical protein
MARVVSTTAAAAKVIAMTAVPAMKTTARQKAGTGARARTVDRVLLAPALKSARLDAGLFFALSARDRCSEGTWPVGLDIFG